MEEARDQQLELKQTQEDLVHATSEQAHLSQRLKAMHQVEEGARCAKETFVANLSHELWRPVNLIIGFSEMLLEPSRVYGPEWPPPILADIAVIEGNSRRPARLVDDVLDLSREDAGRTALSHGPYDEWRSLQHVVHAAHLFQR